MGIVSAPEREAQVVPARSAGAVAEADEADADPTVDTDADVDADADALVAFADVLAEVLAVFGRGVGAPGCGCTGWALGAVPRG